ncbi:hypothetical protein [Streptomyces flaveolus]|uniref:hypothetical protein n=1 Tax=Streptomyces flaveolus TaxID=67297 RepID=UPI0033D5AA6E
MAEEGQAQLLPGFTIHGMGIEKWLAWQRTGRTGLRAGLSAAEWTDSPRGARGAAVVGGERQRGHRGPGAVPVRA